MDTSAGPTNKKGLRMLMQQIIGVSPFHGGLAAELESVD